MDTGKYNFNEAFERLKESFDCGTITALSICLGRAQSGVSRVYLRGTVIPMDWLTKAVIITGTNPMWILFGEPYKKKMLPVDECEPQIESFEELHKFLHDIKYMK